MNAWNTGTKIGICLFLGQAVSLKILEELLKNDILGQGWYLTLSTGTLIAAWQTVQYAYNRGVQDATTTETANRESQADA